MNTAHLALEQTPPLSVPLRFFLTAPLFGVLAAVFLLDSGATIFNNRWNLEIITLIHLLTLGFISMVMFGALLQLLPVLAGIPVPQPRLVSTLIHIFLSMGSLSFAGGLISNQNLLIQIALVLLGLSFGGFIGVVGYCLLNAKSQTTIIAAMRLALLALTVTLILGLGLGSVFGYGNTLSSLAVLTNLHLAWGLIGWVSLLIIGVAYQVVPMFQITPPYPPLVKRWLTPFLFGCLVLWTPFYVLINFHLPLLFLISLGLSRFAITTLHLQNRRLRKISDVTLIYWRIGMIGLLSSTILWLVGVIWPNLGNNSAYPILLGILFIAGSILPIIQGMLYKIVPFLIWLHLQNQQLGILKATHLIQIPHMRQIIPERWARYQLWIYFIAVIFLMSATLHPTGFIYGAGISLILAFSLLAYNLYRAWWLYLTISRQLSTNKP